MSRTVFCIACGQCIDDDAPLCVCDEGRLRDALVRRIRDMAPAAAASRPATPPRPIRPVIGERFDHVARLAARIAAARADFNITGRDMHEASTEAALLEACGASSRKPDGAA